MLDKIKKKDLKLELILSFIISAYSVVFLWGFRGKWVYALWINFTILMSLILVWFWIVGKWNKKKFFKNLFWIIPIMLISISFAIRENPYMKTASLIVLPIGLSLFFYNFLLVNLWSKIWNFQFIWVILNRLFLPLSKIESAIKTVVNCILPNKNKENNNQKLLIVKKSLIWLWIFVVVASVILWLLSSADQEFAVFVSDIINWFLDFVSFLVLRKIIVFSLLVVIIVSIVLAMKLPFTKEIEDSKLKMDSIVSGIVIFWILWIYLLFIAFQLKKIFISGLPSDFSQVELLVKSGFWQLFVLSIINIIFFFVYYKKTNKLVQKILFVFTVSSTFLLYSAGQKIFLYVKYYGFSYEKFMASYTVVYIFILFVSLIFSLFRKKKVNIFKYLVVLFFWMYSIVTVLPVERIIVNSNLYLKNNVAESQIDLNELHILSNDVTNFIDEHDFFDLKVKRNWMKKHIYIKSDKKRYEVNIVNLFENEVELEMLDTETVDTEILDNTEINSFEFSNDLSVFY